MLEFVFFDRRPYDKFAEFARSMGLEPGCRVTDHDEYLIELPEDLDAGILDRVEEQYDRMMGLSEELMAESDDDHYSAAGVQVRLPDGSEIVASVEPAMLRRILSVLSYEELGEFVDSIAASALNPDHRPICRREAS